MKKRLGGKAGRRFASALLVVLIPSLSSLYAQQGLVINVSATSTVIENQPVTIKADVRSFASISQGILFYRNDLSSDFQQADLTLDESSMSLNGTVPGAYVVSPFIEVYIRLIKRDGTSETYPVENPTENPVRIAVNSSPEQQDIIVISPERDQKLTVDDLMIAASMLYAPDFVDRRKTEVYFDGLDVTSNAVVSGDVIVYSPASFPREISRGLHTAKIVLYKTDGSEYRSLEWSFYIVTAGEQAAAETFSYRGNGQLELRNENLAGSSVWYNSGYLNLGSTVYGITLGANLDLTSEEKTYRQPQDRYGFLLGTSWLSVKLGDSYPTFSPLIMNGMRVRGISGKLSAGFFNLEAAYGQTIRGIDGQYLDTVIVSQQTQGLIGSNYLKLNDSTYVNLNYGTYTRNLFAVRPSFDFGSHVELGFTYLKSSDAISSIGLGSDPNQNVVLGTDFSMNFDNHHINFLAESAVSMLNQNTAVGNRTAADIDSISHSDAGDQIDKVVPLSTLSKIITINEFLVPLDPTKLSSLSWDVGVNLNYFNTYAKVGYVYRGPDYTSFGQQYIRTDIRGFNFLLRPRLLSNQVLLTLSYENLFDNLQKNKYATTNFINTNLAASYFPMVSMPTFTLGFATYSNSNSIPTTEDTLHQAIDNSTLRYYVESSYAFTYIIRHNISLNFGISNTNDRTQLGTNLNNFNFAFLVNSDFVDIPLRTTLGFNINGNKNSQKGLDSTQAVVEQIQTFDYTFLTIGASYGLLNDNFTVGVNFTPTFGDFSRIGYGLVASYRVAKSQSINLNLNYFALSGSSDFVGSLVYAVDF
ncbi:MAG TPA: hypothetical protein VIS48_01180 [Candidatus Kryptonia bacterium]